MPLPSHRLACVSVAPWRKEGAHTVPAGYCVHPLAPSHVPLLPHDVGPWAVHSWSGSAPACTGPQVPSAPLPFSRALHATQVPTQATSQHTPSAAEPLRHSLAPSRALPWAFSGAHIPALQKALGTQLVSTAQPDWQVPPAQTPGLQVTVPCDRQAPLPLQRLGCTSLLA